MINQQHTRAITSRMYRVWIITVIVISAFSPKAAGQTRSYIQTEVITVPGVTTPAQVDALSQGSKQTSLTYLDGLGRPIQAIAVQASPLQKDIVQPIEYNSLGQQAKGYLPYVSGATDGGYRAGAPGEQNAFYQITGDKIADDATAYSQQVFENSPLLRILKQGMVGTGYQPVTGQHYKTLSYRSNTAGDQILVWSNDGTTLPTYYTANQLSVTDAVDEQNIETLVFTDLNGHTVLKRQVKGTELLDTYYIYNIAGMVSYVVPPKAVSMMQATGNYALTQTGVNKLLFRYVYDELGRLVEKNVPAATVLYVIYDALNRPVLMQDGNLRGANQWNYIKYDLQGRAISQGIYTDATYTTRTAMQTYVNGVNYSTTWAEYRNGASGTSYYTNSVFPTANIEPLAYTYFDDYDLDGNGTADYSYQSQGLPGEGTATDKTSGLPTIVRKRSIGAGLANIWLTSATFYDNRQRPIQTVGNNQLNATVADVTTTVLNFVDKPLLTKVVKVASATTTVLTAFSYDAMFRLAALDQTYNSNPTVRVASYEYNEIGQLVKRKLHSLSTSAIPADITLGTAESVASGQSSTSVASHSITLSPGFTAAAGSTFTASISAYLQSVDYRYNIRGQMLSINNSTLTADGTKNDDANDVFGMEMNYDDAVAGLGNTPGYNGQLTAVRWMSVDGSGNKSVERSYKYNYDQLNRQISSLYQDKVSGAWNNSGAFDEKDISYDQGGNIMALKRNAIMGGSINPVDDLTYTYDSNNPNQLKSMTDGTGGYYAAYGFKNLTGSAASYTYDDNGNTVADPYKGLSLEYNTLNRVKKITITTATNRYITYTYDAQGTLLRKQQYDNNTLQKTTDYSGGFVYENSTLAYFGTPEGRVRNAGGILKSEYTINDQQGNARVSFEDNGGTARVIQENSYYAFGLVMPGSAVAMPTTPNNNLYNGGSEWQNDFSNLPDYYQTFFRNYDAALGRFISVDPEGESAESLTNYNYAGNNPIMFNDPLGNKAKNQGLPQRITDMWDTYMPVGGSGGNSFTLPDAFGNVPGHNGFGNSGQSFENAFYAQQSLINAARDGDPVALNIYANQHGVAPDASMIQQLNNFLGVQGSINSSNGNYEFNTYTVAGNNIFNYNTTGTQDLNNLILQNHSVSVNANQGGPGPGWWQGAKDYWANVGTAAKMTAGWALGVGADTRVFMNDRVADAMRNSPGIAQARSDYYNKNKTSGTYTFGLKGLWQAGVNPIEQFVGSFSYSISYNQEGGFLQYTITNLTSLRSADYHITPTSWNISPGYPMGDFNQAFIFTEPLRH